MISLFLRRLHKGRVLVVGLSALTREQLLLHNLALGSYVGRFELQIDSYRQLVNEEAVWDGEVLLAVPLVLLLGPALG